MIGVVLGQRGRQPDQRGAVCGQAAGRPPLAISPAYPKPHTRRQHPAALTQSMIRSEPTRTARPPAPSSVPTTGITIYGCEPDEAALFRELAPRFGIRPTITAAAVSELNVGLASEIDASASITRRTSRTPPSCAEPRRRQAHLHPEHRLRPHRRECAESLGISVENVAYSPDSVADYTLMLMLMAVRHAKSVIRRADVHDYRLHEVRGKELRDLTVGVIGTGRIGAAVMERLRGFGCRVLAHDTRPKTAAEYVPLDELARQSDIVTLHTPLTADTLPPTRSSPHRADEARRVDRQHRTRPAARYRGADRGVGERPTRRRSTGCPRRRGRDLLRRLQKPAHRKRTAAAAAGAARTC